MALTLLIEGRKLRSRDHRQMTDYAGRIEPGGAQHSDGIVEALRATAADLRDVANRSGVERPKRRLIYRDALEQMEAKGYLREEQAKAGREIARGYEIKMSSGGAGVGGYCEMVALPCGELIPASVGSLMMERYLPWQEWARATFASAARELTYETVTNLICVKGLGQQQAADELKMDRRTVLDMLRTSLWRYCVLAGMVDDGPQEAA